MKVSTGFNREGWLTELAKQVEPIFRGFTLPKYRLTCGWPCKGALASKGTRVGECHAIESSKGGLHEIFISPLVAEPLEVSGIVCHELAHVAAGIKAKHGKGFVRVCRHVGLIKGPPTSVMPGQRLNDRLKGIIDKLGLYPHSVLSPVTIKKEVKVSSVKLVCVCGCWVRMPPKMLEEIGPPVCACGSEFGPEEKDDGE